MIVSIKQIGGQDGSGESRLAQAAQCGVEGVGAGTVRGAWGICSQGGDVTWREREHRARLAQARTRARRRRRVATKSRLSGGFDRKQSHAGWRHQRPPRVRDQPAERHCRRGGGRMAVVTSGELVLPTRGLNRSRGRRSGHGLVFRESRGSAKLTSEAIRLVHQRSCNHGHDWPTTWLR
jgi:hypothetical protein